MKVEFSETVEFTPTWRKNNELPEAERFKATFTLLEIGEFVDVREGIREVGVKDGQDEKGLSDGQLRSVGKLAAKFLPAHTELKGLEGISLAQIVKYVKFFDLAAELLFKLVNESAPKDDDIKN